MHASCVATLFQSMGAATQLLVGRILLVPDRNARRAVIETDLKLLPHNSNQSWTRTAEPEHRLLIQSEERRMKPSDRT